MGRNVIPEDEWQRTVEIIEKHIQPDGSFALIAAAAAAGIPRNTMQNRYYGTFTTEQTRIGCGTWPGESIWSLDSHYKFRHNIEQEEDTSRT